MTDLSKATPRPWRRDGHAEEAFAALWHQYDFICPRWLPTYERHCRLDGYGVGR